MANINGTSGNDTLPGPGDPDTSGDDTIHGLGGDDTIDGGAGSDSLFGDDNNDNIQGGADNDLLDGGDGNDVLDGGAGLDQLLGWDGNDTMVAAGGDSANGGNGDDTLTVKDGLGSIYDGGTDITDDTLTLDFALAASGVTASFNLMWVGNTGQIGGATVSNFEKIGGPIVGSGFDDNINIGANYASAVTMNLGAGDDTGFGGSGGDTLTGGLGNDDLFGGGGNDTLSDADGIGYLDGEGGDDLVTLGAMTGGTADGGLGITDRLNFDFAAAASGMSVSLNFSGGSMSGNVGGVSISGFEAQGPVFNQTTNHNDTVTLGAAFDRAMTINLLGGNDTYTGGLGGDYVNGGDGNDVIGGGAGTNTLIGGIGNDTFVVDNVTTTLNEAAGQGTDTVLASLNWTLASEFENLTLNGFGNINGYGNDVANVITGNNGNNVIDANGGNDTVNGGSGGDTINGGAGNDTLNGDGGNDHLADYDGTNTLNGGGGDDYIQFFGDAVNSADGGAGGYDVLEIFKTGRTTGFVIDLTGMWSGGSGTVNGGTVTGFEGLIGFEGTQWADVVNFGAGTSAEGGITDAGAGDDILTGSDGDNYIVGGAGNDTIASGAGTTDELHGGAGNDMFILNANTGGWVYGDDGIDTLDLVPVQGVALNIDLTLVWSGGTGFVNGVAVSGIEILQYDFIEGAAPFFTSVDDNVVIGAGYTGNVHMELGTGADSVTGGSGNDLIDGAQDNDIVHGGAGNDQLGGSYGSDYVYGDAGDDTIGGDTLDVEWAWGNDHLYGGDGNDTIEAGAYQDWLYGEAGNDILRGDSLALGAPDHGNDTLDGGAGNDQLIGMGGNDALFGGLGADAMAGGTGNDVYLVDNGGDVVTELAGEGTDTVYTTIGYALAAGSAVETLTVYDRTTTNILSLYGNALGQLVYGNNAANLLSGGGGADTLYGMGGNDAYYIDGTGDVVYEYAGGGNDTIYTTGSFNLSFSSEIELITVEDRATTNAVNLLGNAFGQTIYGNAGANVLRGGGGTNSLFGFAGNDAYLVDDLTDQVTELAGQGTDTVYTTGHFVLTAGSEIEVLSVYDRTTTNALNMAGNALGQTIYGNAGNNVIDGKAGADTIFLMGGTDKVFFSTALGGGNVDALVGFASGDDKIQLNKVIFAGLAPGALAADAFVLNALPADANDRLLYNQTTGQLFFDADGNGAGAAVLFATLGAGTALAASDFLVI